MEDKLCKGCGEIKPITEYYKHGPYIASRCRVCYNERHRNRNEKKLGIHNYEGCKNDLEGAKNALMSLGYDLETSIHEQFKERVKERYGVELP